MRRLYSLHRLFERNPNVQLQYSKVLQTYLDKGYIAEVKKSDVLAAGVNQWFLPHFPVIREDRATTKVRVVFDGSAKVNGFAINDFMYTGPKLQNDLVNVLLRFCRYPVALAADISEMFLQVQLRDSDRRYHRFVWSKAPEDPLQVFEFCRVVFGIRSSPYLAGRALKAAAEEFAPKTQPEVASAVNDNFYVDDLLTSTPTVASACSIRRDLQQVTKYGGFHLRKWISNEQEVLKSIPEEDRATQTTIFISDRDTSSASVQKTLGVTWNPEKDQFRFIYPSPDSIIYTPRGVLSQMCRLFDPRGQLCPFTIRSRIMCQETCIRGKQWDEALDDDHRRQWKKWFSEFPELSDVHVNRCFSVSGSDQLFSLHTFSDASKSAYAAATYVRHSRPDGSTKVTLAMAKARPSPIKRKTIPMLELQGGVLGSRLSKSVGNVLDIPPERQHFWTDSMNVLYWVKSPSRKFRMDVGNRISEIQDVTDVRNWHHVPGKLNPADMPSRGISASQLASDHQWWHGPDFLTNPESSWPNRQIIPPSELPGQLRHVMTNVSAIHVSDHRLHPDKYSSWDHLVRITAWCRRFIRNACKKVPSVSDSINLRTASKKVTVPGSQKDIMVPELTVDEILESRYVWIRQAQRDIYGSTFDLVQSESPLPASSPLLKLQPMMDSTTNIQVMKVNGRLRAANHLPVGVRNPIILPAKHRVTSLIVAAADQQSNHSIGSNHLLSNLSTEYWIIKGKSVVKAHRSKCVLCKKMYAKTASPVMGLLPDFRTTEPLQPFSKTRVDFAGPFLTKQGRGRVHTKRYACVFTCLQTRACHLEMVYSLDTDGFLLALSRFTKRRGVPTEILSDNGTNFTAADQELKNGVQSLDNSRISAELSSLNIKWRFNPPRAPHFGGVFEIVVKAMKKVLQATLYRADLSDEELHTALVQAEGLINSRPLCVTSTDSCDLEPLTPLHFLVGHASVTVAAEVSADQEKIVHPCRRWKYVQRVVRDVWRRWLKELVPRLNARSKWQRQEKSISKGDIVMVHEENAPRACWPIGRVVETFVGRDGVVRVVEVEIKGKIYKRSVHRLVPLDVEGAAT